MTFPEPVCVLNGCTREQGIGTWVQVRMPAAQVVGGQTHNNLPVCEQHWEALRMVPR